MFSDFAKIKVQAGAGGNGIISFRRERSIAKGGPDGGDGGRGGSVIFIADPNLDGLGRFLQKKIYKATDGKNGGRNDCHGHDGIDLTVKVPIGTIVYEINDKGKRVPIADFQKKSQQLEVAQGGKGGFGNAHFRASVRQSPRFRELGARGEQKKLILELKTIADIGLVGLPNSGKSTFLAAVTKARPKIANYPFTTLSPNLGVVNYGSKNLILADIPGLIAGAHAGKGLGHQFLKHIERTRLIVHFIDIQSLDPVVDYQVIRAELNKFSRRLAAKPEVICFTKIDTTGWLPNGPELNEYISNFSQQLKIKDKIFAISAVAHQGTTDFLKFLFGFAATVPRVKTIVKIVKKPVVARDFWEICKKGRHSYIITSQKLDRFVATTELDNEEGVARLRDIIGKMGMLKTLEEQGLQTGDEIVVGKNRFKW